MFKLDGKNALVTGGGRGLGKAIARALAEAGANVAITSRNKNSLAAEVNDLKKMTNKALAIDLDVTNYGSIKKCVTTYLDTFETIDILVNNAGCNVRKSSVDISWDDWDMVLNTNLKGSFFLSQQVAGVMIEKGYGKIINIGSLTSFYGFPGIAPYCASRGGIMQLTKSLSAEWADKGINVNCIAPGWFQTEQTGVLFQDQQWVDYALERIPKGRFGRGDDLAGITVFLASDASEYITGQTIPVCGGFSTGKMRVTPFSKA